MAGFITLLAALVVIAGFTGQNVTIVYLLDSAPISPFGIIALCGVAFSVIFGVGLLLFAAVTRDASALAVSDDPAQCRVFVSPFPAGLRGGAVLTHAQVALAVGFLNSLNGWLIVYASPPDRTPPLIQAVLQNAGVLFSVPFSKLALGDRKAYCAGWPLAAAALIVASVAVSLTPSVINGDGSSSLSGASAIAWCFVYVAGLAPGAGYNVCQQLYFLRSGMLEPGVTGRAHARATLRALFYANVGQALSYGLTWWLDLVPWFGTSSSVGDFGGKTAFSFACAIGGPPLAGLVSSDACSTMTPVWMWSFIGAYAVSYLGAAVLNRESATFNMLVLVVVTMTTAAFWLIPGTNPNPTGTPLWSVLTSLALSIVGSIVWKRWENATMPAEEQFSVGADAPGGFGAGGGGGYGGGRSFHGDADFSYSSLGMMEDDGLDEPYGAYGGVGLIGGGVSDAVRDLVARHQARGVGAGAGTVNAGGGGGGGGGGGRAGGAGVPKYARLNL
jgi:hypothetical protein